jgi:hypothetical protein
LPVWALLVVGSAALLAARLAMALLRSGPVIFADEIGYLTNARVPAGELAGAPFYRGGYSLLIKPILGLHADPTATYRLVLVANAVLAASLLPLLYVLLTRCFDIAPRVAGPAAFAAAAYPSVTCSRKRRSRRRS